MKPALSTRLLLPALGVLLALGMAEAVLRVFSIDLIGGTRIPFLTVNPHTGWAFRPNAEFTWAESGESRVQVKINSKGLRDREHPYEAAQDRSRLLVLGDSYTAALQVPLEEAWHQVVAQRLAEKAAAEKRIEVINAGVNGWGTDQQLLFYRHEGYRYGAGLVLLEFFGGNDLLDNHTAQFLSKEEKPYFIQRNGELELHNYPFRGRYRGVGIGSLRVYQFARFTRDTVLKFFRKRQAACGPGRIPSELQLYARTTPADVAAGWNLTAALLRQLNKEVAARGEKLAVVFFPARRIVVEADWERAMRCYPAAATWEWDRDKPNRLVAELAAQEDIPYLDMTPAFRAETPEAQERLYYRIDKHLTPAGHRFAGRLISDWLIRQQLVLTRVSQP